MIKEFFSNNNPLFKRFFLGLPIKLIALLFIVFLFSHFSCNKEKYRIDKELIRSLEGKFVIDRETISIDSKDSLLPAIRKMDSVFGGEALLQIQLFNLDSGIIKMDFSWGNLLLWSSISKPIEPTTSIYNNRYNHSYRLIYRSRYFLAFSTPFILDHRIKDFFPDDSAYFVFSSYPPNSFLSIDSRNLYAQNFYFKRIK
jgi:hypothetical protein